ncbi:unnamed protein product [Prunus armeniaca]|uniref:Pentatricopeptide repeat-containing protein n=1 Tax=Prunus armeniaca TaxID=36596 RepID=A0A6J5U553_PRUAR|nr:unnamed protein product [Prunus armeniaca]CAB4300905.1 unnamed protein product [Prunus armeniaca]
MAARAGASMHKSLRFVQGGRPYENVKVKPQLSSGQRRPWNFSMTCTSPVVIELDQIRSQLPVSLQLVLILLQFDHGIWVHGYLRRSGMESHVVIGIALVDMYGKCGCVDKAYEADGNNLGEAEPCDIFWAIVSLCSFWFSRERSLLYHYASMVDMLSRAGLIEEAERFIRSMPMKPYMHLFTRRLSNTWKGRVRMKGGAIFN